MIINRINAASTVVMIAVLALIATILIPFAAANAEGDGQTFPGIDDDNIENLWVLPQFQADEAICAIDNVGDTFTLTRCDYNLFIGNNIILLRNGFASSGPFDLTLAPEPTPTPVVVAQTGCHLQTSDAGVLLISAEGTPILECNGVVCAFVVVQLGCPLTNPYAAVPPTAVQAPVPSFTG